MWAFIVANVLEALAFILSIIYYQKYKTRENLFLSWFLGITLLAELLGYYAGFIENSFLHFLEGTVFEKNYWIGNTYSLISFIFFIHYFKWQIRDKNLEVFLNVISIIIGVFGVGEIVFTKGFFDHFMPLTNVLGSFFVVLSISLYYLKLLKSDLILQINKLLPFYISVGTLLFFLCTTPIILYSNYYSLSIDSSFVTLYKWTILGFSYLMYSIYSIGFIVCLKIKPPYYPRSDY